jgi:hypothetical protein
MALGKIARIAYTVESEFTPVLASAFCRVMRATAGGRRRDGCNSPNLELAVRSIR